MSYNNDITIIKIIEFLNTLGEEIKFTGNQLEVIEGYSSIYEYKENTITWLKNEEVYKIIEKNINNPVKLIVLPREHENFDKFSNYIKADNPHRVFFQVVEKFFTNEKEYFIGKNNFI